MSSKEIEAGQDLAVLKSEMSSTVLKLFGYTFT